MIFSSPRFFFFLLAVLCFLSLRLSLRKKKIGLAVASCFFYAAWDVRYLALLLLVSVIDYYCANRIATTSTLRVRKAWLCASVISNLGILAYFKYYNFFVDNLNGLLQLGGLHVVHLEILLPIGISFYTLKSLSYTIDVYRRELEPVRSQLDYTTFVTFFPELIAGPIVRASVFLPQMERSIGPTRERLAWGAQLFLLGLTKKLLIADNVAVVADDVFANPALYSGATLMLGLIAYAIQIYCDFSGYSDMAIGTARMIGYDLPENFNMPYVSRSITEFWRRWHITLSSWLRDYLYIPLGGNRKGRLRTYVNLLITMLLGGLWHGASWNFVIWGALHGLALAVHKAYRSVVRTQMPALVSGFTTLAFVVLCWIPFRAETFSTASTFVTRMVTLQPGVNWRPPVLFFAIALVVLGHIAGSLRDTHLSRFLPVVLENHPLSGWSVKLRARTLAGSYLLAVWILFIFFFARTRTSPFIYFQF